MLPKSDYIAASTASAAFSELLACVVNFLLSSLYGPEAVRQYRLGPEWRSGPQMRGARGRKIAAEPAAAMFFS
jgi:hypothetical protein